MSSLGVKKENKDITLYLGE